MNPLPRLRGAALDVADVVDAGQIAAFELATPRLEAIPAALPEGAPGWSRLGRYGPLGEWVKDVTDRVFAGAGLLLISPLLAVIALAVRLDSPGRVFFRQVRIGRGGRPFTFWKFRGMVSDARERFPHMYDYRFTAGELQDLRFHPDRDPRVTRVGRFIRRTSLDELPNLINVVLGDMSLVGPRPEIPEMLPHYGDRAELVLSVKPGITSLAKLVGRDQITFAETLDLDVRYVRERSLGTDFRLLLGTVVLVLTGRSIGH